MRLKNIDIMQQTKPIKRSKELVPLSREHHDGLLLCWKIRTGLSNKTDISRIVDYTLHFCNTSLKLHFQKEEKFLFTLLPATDSFRIQAEDEHEKIEKYTLRIKQETNNAEKTLNDFADLLEQHIRFEERNLFPHIEQVANAQELQVAGMKIDSGNQLHEKEWNDTFWLK